jgi:hypothetical protein
MKTIVVVCQTNTEGQENRIYDGGAHGPTNVRSTKAKVLPGKSDSYDHTHINRMKAMLDHVGAEYDRFVAITNANIRKIDTSIEVLPLPKGDEYLGWWSKMYMYNPNLRFNGTVMYIDLDMMPGELFNNLWSESPEYDVLCRRAPHKDGMRRENFLPGVNREGEQWDYLSWIYNTSVIRFCPDKMGSLWLWYQHNIQHKLDLGLKGDELFVAKWLIDNSDWVKHGEFDVRYMPSYPNLILRHFSGNPLYDPLNKSGIMNPLPIHKRTEVTTSENIIPWHRLTAVTMGGAWKPWTIAVNDSHIAERYYGEEL